jgi:hypothetical protein
MLSRDGVWLQMGFGLMTGFIAHLDTARDYILQFTITHTSVHSHIFIAIAWQHLPLADVRDTVKSRCYFTAGGLPPIISSWNRSPWGSWTENVFLLNTCGHSPYLTSSLTRGWVCLLWTCLALSRVRITYMTCYWKFFLVRYRQVLCPGFAKQIMSILLILCYNGSLAT